MTADLQNAMIEYSQAIRGDWSMFDGRTERDIIESWVEELRSPDHAHTLAWWRDELGICPDGNGHWSGFKWGHCSKEECPMSWKRENPDV